MMDVLDHYFTALGFEVTTEPNLNVGRSDLGVFAEGKKPLYVEIGTVSVYKLLANLSTMGGAIFLLVPDELRAIELETSST